MSGSDIMTTKNIITDQNGDLVQTTWTTIVARTGGEIDENIAHAVMEVIRHGAS
jgi:hypothetical protein